MAVDVVARELTARQMTHGRVLAAEAEALVEAQLAAANAVVFEAARTERRYEGMGTTLVLALWHEGGVTYGHVGDSRLYLMRDRQLTQLTRDHSIVQEQLERGAITSEQARHSVNRNVLTRAVGIDPYVPADIGTLPARPDDLYLLCSDGLTEMMTDAEIRQTLLESGSDLPRAAHHLVERANEAGGLDNISVILVYVEPEVA
jgi:protein phosphatase